MAEGDDRVVEEDEVEDDGDGGTIDVAGSMGIEVSARRRHIAY